MPATTASSSAGMAGSLSSAVNAVNGGGRVNYGEMGRLVIPKLEYDTMLLSKGAQECLQWLTVVKGYSTRTTENYGLTYQQFLAFLRAQNLEDSVSNFTPERVMGFVLDLGSRGVTGNTILNKLGGLSTLARFLMRRKDGRGKPVLTEDPTQGVEHPRYVTPVTHYLFPPELQAFLSHPVEPHLAIARELFVDTGIRVSEAIEANVGDLTVAPDGHVTLRVKVKGRRAANAEPGAYDLSSACYDHVAQWLKSRGPLKPDAPLLVDRMGQRWRRSQLGEAMIALGRAAGITRITTSPHKLRHTVGVITRLEGIDDLTRSRMLNHRTTNTLRRYDHLVPGETAKGREKQREGLRRYVTQASEPVPQPLRQEIVPDALPPAS